MIAENIGFNRVMLRWRLDRSVTEYTLYRLGDDGSRELLARTEGNEYIDTVPVSMNKKSYSYVLVKGDRGSERTEAADTSPTDWCEGLLPMPYLPGRPGWVEIYRKAWQLVWKSIVTSDALPFTYAYNDYPDNDTTYVWDSCFCSLFQRYAAIQGVHPCMSTLDNFYALQQPNGYIVRNFRTRTFESKYSKEEPSLISVNPPLFAWAEWNYYMISGDRERLIKVLPRLKAYYGFIESFLQQKSWYYCWSGDGSGWDNINWNEGSEEIYWYVDMFGQQALAAKCIADIAAETGEKETEISYRSAWKSMKRPLKNIYWNSEKSWFCSLTRDGRFTRKTLNGMWPVIAGIAEKPELDMLVKETLLNPECFNTKPMPLPVLSRDEHGYNHLGEYWLGGVWINISLMVIKGLYENRFFDKAFMLAGRTLESVWNVYRNYKSFPKSLWECYAPQAEAPSSHKIVSPDKPGGVREEFGGWTCNIINLLLENILGFYADAPGNLLFWDMQLNEDHGIDRLRFGKVCTDLKVLFTGNAEGRAKIYVSTDLPYKLKVRYCSRITEYDVIPGENKFTL